MPTGYTADIAQGIGFDQFVWNCARAFGALIMLRDEPAGAAIPERFEPSTSYQKWIGEARAEVARLEALTGDEIGIAAAGAYEVALASWRKREAGADALRAKYEAMLAKVLEWKPNPMHESLQQFMADQIRESIRFDCSGSTQPVQQEAAAWLAGQLEHHRRMLGRYEQMHLEEVARTEERNQWLKVLRESVPPPAAGQKAAA